MLLDDLLVRGGRAEPAPGPVPTLPVRRPSDTEGCYQWVTLANPSADELEPLVSGFGIHPVAVEDAGEEHQRAKVETYGDVLLVVLKTLRDEGTGAILMTGEINLFLGPDFVVCVLHGDAARHGADSIVSRLPETFLARGPVGAGYACIDAVVDAYEELAAVVHHDADELDVEVFEDDAGDHLPRIHRLKRRLGGLRRAALPLHDPLQRLVGSPDGRIPADLLPYFGDVVDHLRRLEDQLNHIDAVAAMAFEVYATQISLRQNEDMRRISAWAALVLVPTLVAGVYGMNFHNMPELGWRYGYAWALGLMALAVSILFWLLKRYRWL